MDKQEVIQRLKGNLQDFLNAQYAEYGEEVDSDWDSIKDAALKGLIEEEGQESLLEIIDNTPDQYLSERIRKWFSNAAIE